MDSRPARRQDRKCQIYSSGHVQDQVTERIKKPLFFQFAGRWRISVFANALATYSRPFHALQQETFTKKSGKGSVQQPASPAIKLQPTAKLFLPQIHNYYEEKQYNTSKKFIPLLLFMNKPTSTAGIRQRRLPDKSRKSLFPSLENKFTTARESIGTVFFIICTKKTP